MGFFLALVSTYNRIPAFGDRSPVLSARASAHPIALDKQSDLRAGDLSRLGFGR